MIPHNPPGFCRVVVTGFSYTADLESILISTNCAHLYRVAGFGSAVPTPEDKRAATS
jgi:hypothetical protein